MDDDERCDGCMFWRRDPSGNGQPRLTGLCRRYPNHHVTNNAHSCGEYRRKLCAVELEAAGQVDPEPQAPET